MARTPVCFPPRVKFHFDFDTLTMKVVDDGELRAGAFVVMLVNTLDRVGLNQGEDFVWLRQNVYPNHFPVKFMTADGMTLAKMMLAS
jgi:hypothetical protein